MSKEKLRKVLAIRENMIRQINKIFDETEIKLMEVQENEEKLF